MKNHRPILNTKRSTPLFKGGREGLSNLTRKGREALSGVLCLLVVIALFAYLAWVMGLANALNTIMNTAHDLLLNTVFYLMGICVITSAIGRLFVDFGVVTLLEKLLRPLMRPLFNLPGVASLGAAMTFLSDNPAIISLAKDPQFKRYFRKYEYISLTNFGTAFGMGLLVMVFMVGHGFMLAPLVGLFGAFCGCIVSTRLMQRFILKQYPKYREEQAQDPPQPSLQREGDDPPLPSLQREGMKLDSIDESNSSTPSLCEENKGGSSTFLRILNALLDGGKAGVEVGIAIIPGVLIISTFVMVLTFGAGADGYTGAAYQGTALLPWLAGKVSFIFDWLFGLKDPHLVAFPITALGAVGAALGLVPSFMEQGWIDGNAIAVFTAIGMCWSGFLSTHTAMLDSIGYRELTSKAILAHTIGGLAAAFAAHWVFVLVMWLMQVG
ncbi:MAG: nucleoside recognition domain-containing protein [Paludibacteraceae bacterium]